MVLFVVPVIEPLNKNEETKKLIKSQTIDKNDETKKLIKSQTIDSSKSTGTGKKVAIKVINIIENYCIF